MQQTFCFGDVVEFDSNELDATVRGTIQEGRGSFDSGPEALVLCTESADGTQKYDHSEWVAVSRLRKSCARSDGEENMKQQIIKQLDQEIEYSEQKLSAMKAIYDKAPTNLVAFLCYMNMLTAAIQTYKIAVHVVEAAKWADVDVSEWGDARDALLQEMRDLENTNPLGPITVTS